MLVYKNKETGEFVRATASSDSKTVHTFDKDGNETAIPSLKFAKEFEAVVIQDEKGNSMIQAVREYFKDTPHAFEHCAAAAFPDERSCVGDDMGCCAGCACRQRAVDAAL